MRKTAADQDLRCPCGSGKSYGDCCASAHGGMASPTAEALMRSRYSAFVLRLEVYLATTWHASTRPKDIQLLMQDPSPKWLGLEVRACTTSEDSATIEFVARYRSGGGSATRLHETSRFVREGGRWYYVDGEHR